MLRAIFYGSIALAAFAGVYAFLAPPVPVEDVGSAAVGEAAPAPATPAEPRPLAALVGDLRPAAESGPEERLALAFQVVRNVTPDDFTAPPVATAPLVRIAPPRVATADAPPAPRPKRLRNPVIASAGILVAEGRKIRLAGIEAPTFAERCGTGDDAWPCGRMARAALRRFVHGRAIECEMPAGAAEVPDPALCRVGGEDLAAWLVAQGWARNLAGFSDGEAAAREEKRGLWADARPDLQAGALADNSPDRARAISDRVSSIP